MSDTQESLSAILAEARDKYTVHDCNECDFRKSCERSFGSDECKSTRKSIFLAFGIEDGYFTKLLDRIEAAAKREQQDAMKTAFLTKCKVCEKVGPAAPGNAAAMREALIKAKLYFDHRGEGTNLDDAGMAIDAITSIDAALAAPARNCDRPKDRAEDAFMAKFGRPWTTAEDELATWLFAPAEVDHG